MFNYKSYADLSRDISANLGKLPPIDIVVGIPRSGLVPAIMIAALRNARFYDLDTFLFVFAGRRGTRAIVGQAQQKPSVLVVDDTVNTGAELGRTRERLAPLSDECDFTFCAIYGTEPDSRPEEADIVLSSVRPPRVFQWNYRNHIIAEHAIFDLDGVLCADPTDEENDDGEAYIEFLARATPLTIPAKVISAIATSRLERYRPQTAAWLEANGVRYKDLLMLDLPSAVQRRKLRAHAPFKAGLYKTRDELLFVESNWKQARFIAREADKPVICTANDFLLTGREHLERLEASGELPDSQPGLREAELQRWVQQLTDRLIQTDPYAVHWLRGKGLRADPARLTELSPFIKGRILSSAVAAPLEPAPKRPAGRKGNGRRRVLMISATFDVERGAGAAASSERLRDALEAAGTEVHTISLDDTPNLTGANVDQPVFGSVTGFWNSYADGVHWRSLQSKIDAINPDCIILGAIDRGILTMLDLARLRYPVVWVVRDNWVHTGGCLFKLPPQEVRTVPSTQADFLGALTCEGYLTGCQICPALKDVRESPKARLNFEFKRIVLQYRQDMVFAPISPWMEAMLRRAPLTSSHVIAPAWNPIDLHRVRPLARRPKDIRRRFGIPPRTRLVLLSAHSLSNPRKGLKHLLEPLAADTRFQDVVFVTMGQQKDGESVLPAGLRSVSLGFVETEDEKVAIYNEVDATLVPALQESLSVVASDSICCGTPVVAYRTSGLATFLKHKETGYLAKPFSGRDLLNGLDWVLFRADAGALSSACREQARAVFDRSANTDQLLQAVDTAIARFASLGPVPENLLTLASAMELMHEDLHFRADHAREQARKAREAEKAARLNPNALYHELDSARQKLDWNRKRRAELEAEIDALQKQRHPGRIRI